MMWLWMPPFLIENYLKNEENFSFYGSKNVFANRAIIWKYILNFLSNKNWSKDVIISESFVTEVKKMINKVMPNNISLLTLLGVK